MSAAAGRPAPDEPGLFTPPLRGLSRIVSGPTDSLVPRLRAAGWTVGVVQGVDKAGFLQETARQLHFPSWFGNNFDALADCLGDLSEPTALLWLGWDELAARHPHDWQVLHEILTERVHAPGTPFTWLRPSAEDQQR